MTDTYEWGTDPYNAPSKHGLEIVGVASDQYASSGFDDFVVWRDLETGQLFWASDSGCSCPSPFEDYRTRDDLTTGTATEAAAAALAWAESFKYDWIDNNRHYAENLIEAQRVIRQIREVA